MLKIRTGSKRLANAATVAGVLAACGLAQAQVMLFDSGPACQSTFNGGVTYLGFSAGQPLTATQALRCFAAPFTLTTNSVVTEVDVDGFVPAGFDPAEFGWQIWNRLPNNPSPTPADRVAGVLNATPAPYAAFFTPIQDPRMPTGATYLAKVVIPGGGVALPAGNYWFSMWGHGQGAANTQGTNGFCNFAWMGNAQKDPVLCPSNTPIVISGDAAAPGTNNNLPGLVHGWRANDASVSFLRYDNPTTVLNTVQSPTVPLNGPNPQDFQYLYSPAFTVIGNPTGTLQGACCLANGGCSFTDPTTCCSGGGTYKGHGVLCASANCPQVGRCCLVDANGVTSCIDTTQATCTNATNLGEYQGDGTSCTGSGSCPATGACCLENGTCVLSYSARCTSLGGLFRGNGVACGSTASACAPFGVTLDDDNNDSPDILPGRDVSGFGQKLLKIHGSISLADRADIYRINVCDKANFTASTVGNGNTLDTILALFDNTGKGLGIDDDTGNGTAQSSSQSIVTGQYLPASGIYFLAIAEFNNTLGSPAGFNSPLDNVSAPIFVEPSPWGAATNPVGGAGWPEWSPNGTSATKILNTAQPAWANDPDVLGTYTISLTGACFLGCYANCDGSTVTPVLNANDFQCFLNAFAGSIPPAPNNYFGYANCDGSSVAPVMNANDFQCFLNAFAAGCPS